jgi:hypothetical protein
LGAALPLPAGAAGAESAGADVDADDGEAAGGVSPHAATIAPIAAMAARSAIITIFFMIVFSSEVPTRRGPSPYASALPGPSITRRFDVLPTI